MADVRPLDRRKAHVVAEPAAAPRPVRRPAFVVPEKPAAVERVGESFTVLASEVDRRELRELQAGRRSPEAVLDLHGLTGDRVGPAVATFVRRARRDGHRCVLVIHGRGHRSGPGGPVLRDRLIEALCGPLAGDILAAATAPSAHGGRGAALMLLRKARQV
jgi:DNA-nicking Smr family endonuclease